MPNFVRKFPVKLEGQEETLWIASAMCAQTEEFLSEQALAMKEEEDLVKRTARLERNSYVFLVNCLNNAVETSGEKWTIESIRGRMDKLLIDAAMTVAQKESGLVSPNQTTPSTAV